jgi:HJR/Mrr/RecB family endonuclease
VNQIKRRRRDTAVTQAQALAYWQQFSAREQAAARGQARHYAYLESSLYDIDRMDGVDFEHYIAARLRAAGYTVEITRTTGDFGVDIIATKSGNRIAVQCKRYGKPIGVKANTVQLSR